MNNEYEELLHVKVPQNYKHKDAIAFCSNKIKEKKAEVLAKNITNRILRQEFVGTSRLISIIGREVIYSISFRRRVQPS